MSDFTILVWILEKLCWPVGLLILFCLVHRCFNAARVNQRLALGDVWSDAADRHERRGLLLPAGGVGSASVRTAW